MKRLLFLLICFIIAVSLIGCDKPSSEGKEEGMDSFRVTFINDVEETDVWVLPQTPEILKTSIWGKVTLSKLGVGESAEVELVPIDENSLFIFRAIDTDDALYRQNDIMLKSGYTLKFYSKEDEEFDGMLIFLLDVLDEKGNVLSSEEVFEGVL